jgi:osmotically-inducible protein OsmY
MVTLPRLTEDDDRMIRQISAPLALVVVLSLTGCAAAVVGSAGAVGMGAAEERGLEGAVDDTKIRTAINGLWLDNNFTLFREVTLSVNEGRVMLTGSVEQPETRIEAVRLAWQAAGVRQVIDEIQVTDQSGFKSGVQDAWISNKLRTKLMFDSQIKNINYTIDVENGVVYLMGLAQSQDELDRVIATARDISDVKKVVNHVMLKSDPRRNSQ